MHAQAHAHALQTSTKPVNIPGLMDRIAIARVEQICPFPYDGVTSEMAKYPNAKVTWVQEEHKNMGAWSYVQPRFETATGHKIKIAYVGRNVSPSPATGM